MMHRSMLFVSISSYFIFIFILFYFYFYFTFCKIYFDDDFFHNYSDDENPFKDSCHLFGLKGSFTTPGEYSHQLLVIIDW